MQLTSRQRLIFAWLIISSLAALVCSLLLPAAHLGNEYLPMGNDSFYHARRILDTAANPAAFYQFDSQIHAPEGSLLTWPWGYDYLMGWLVRIGVMLHLAEDPLAILTWIPVIAVFISIGLIILIAQRLSLALWPTVLAGLCVALSPLTQYLHGVGFIDHHYAEYIFVLATIAIGLDWFLNPNAARPALLLGLTLGLAPAIHNGLFILQFPVLICLYVLWSQGIRTPKQTVAYFCATLLVATIAILVPSLPFRLGHFEYYTLSWFHLYVACATVIASLLTCRLLPTPKGIALAVIFIIALLVPLTNQIMLGQTFLAGTSTRLDAIAEVKSIRQLAAIYGPSDISNRYSLLIWLTPLTFIFCVYMLWRTRRSGQFFFWISSTLGLTLLAMQFRLHYFGSYALYLPWLFALENLTRRWPTYRRPVLLVASLFTVLLYWPPMRHQLLGPMPHANDIYFHALRPMLASLQQACAKEPGIVLADNDAGHYIRYYTDCSVIANNFLLTKQHGDKIHAFERLMSLSAEELPKAAPYIRYVLVRPADIKPNANGAFTYLAFSSTSTQLVGDLLLKPFASIPAAVPSQYERIAEVRLADAENLPYARLYRIHAASPSTMDH